MKVSILVRNGAGAGGPNLAATFEIDPTSGGAQGTVAGLHAWVADHAGLPADATVEKVLVRDVDEAEEDEIELSKDKLIKTLIAEGSVIVVETAPAAGTTGGDVAGWMDPATDGDRSYGRVRFHQGARLVLDLFPEM